MAVSYTHLDVYKRQPLKKADDAVLIDSSNMNIEEVVNKIKELAKEGK